jgi:hypothetical protein
MKIDTEVYKEIEILVFYNERTKYFFATSIVGNSHNEFDTRLNNFCGGFKTPKEAVNDVRKQIDAFLQEQPKTYEELAQAITKTLVWTGYEDCYADTFIVQKLVEGFLKTKGIEL